MGLDNLTVPDPFFEFSPIYDKPCHWYVALTSLHFYVDHYDAGHQVAILHAGCSDSHNKHNLLGMHVYVTHHNQKLQVVTLLDGLFDLFQQFHYNGSHHYEH